MAQEKHKYVWIMKYAQWPFNPGLSLYLYPSQVKLLLSHSKEPNPQQAEQGYAQMQQCL
jgi:hypothetical protein